MSINTKTVIALGSALVAWIGVAAQPAAAAEVIYKSIGPRGEVTYGWSPARDAVTTEKIEIPALSPAQRQAVTRLRGEGSEAARAADEYAQRRTEQWRKVELELKAAHSALRRAENALERGRDPRAGEMIPNKGAGMRFTQAYFDRIAGLEAGVDAARRRLDAAYDARNQLQ